MVNISPGRNSSPLSGVKFCCDYMASFGTGLSTFFPLLPFCFVEYSVNATAQTHVSTRAEILLRLYMRFFSLPARDEDFQPGLKFSMLSPPYSQLLT